MERIGYYKYTRCSTEEQQQGYSHAYQISGLTKAHHLKEWQDLGTFSDTISGRTFDRPQLDLLYDVSASTSDYFDRLYVVVYRWDRLGRDVGEAFQAIKKFKNAGVEINCPDKWINYNDSTWPVMLAVEFGVAHAESLKISERTRDGIRAANEAGYFTATAPPGYKRIFLDETTSSGKRRQELVPDDKAPAVVEVFEQYTKGYTRAELFERYGAAVGVGRSSFYRMFTNLVYTGKFMSRGQIYQGRQEAIISPELWRAVQERIQAERSSSGKYVAPASQDYENRFYLKGSIRCAHTGRHLTGAQVRKSSGRYFFYYQRAGGQTINAIDANQAVSRALGELQIPDALYHATRKALEKRLAEKQRDDKKRAKALSKEIKHRQERLQRLDDRFADGEIGGVDYSRIRQRYLAEIEARTTEHDEIRRAAGGEYAFRMNILDKMHSLVDIFQQSDARVKRMLLRAIFPEGFAVEEGKVKTLRVNKFLMLSLSNSENYTYIEIKRDAENTQHPSLGGRSETLKTDLSLLTAFLAA